MKDYCNDMLRGGRLSTLYLNSQCLGDTAGYPSEGTLPCRFVYDIYKHIITH